MKLKRNSEAEAFDLWLGKAAPRYTSYPPAPFFTPAVAAAEYANSLKTLEENAPISLYIHIPYCRELCLYCGCNTLVTNRADRVTAYLVALKQEIRRVAALAGKRRVDSLHFGGGTPNMLGAEDMRDLFATLRDAFDFSTVREIAMELDPRVVWEGQAEVLAECGVTRVSLGVQDFNAEVQEIIHRVQPFETVAQVCVWLRQAGITNINFDLIYGLPKQTKESIADTATRVMQLDPSRIALFSYAHVPQMKKHQKALEQYGMPDMIERLELDKTARSIFAQHGYAPLGIDHFAKPEDTLLVAARESRLHRNFQGYTEDAMENLIGLGCSSISQTTHGYFQNEHDERGYISMIKEGNLAVRRGYLLTAEDRVRGAIIEQFMCALACDVAAIAQHYEWPVESFAEDVTRLKPFAEAGLIAVDNWKVTLATPYRMAIRVIARAFDPHTQNTQQILSSKTA